MADRGPAEVKQYVEWLQHDSDHTAMRDLMKERHKLVNMLKTPDLPEHMTRGVGVAEPTPVLLWLARNLSSAQRPYPTTITISALGDTTEDGQKMADKAEKAASLWQSRCDDGGRVTADTIDGQLLSPYVVWQLLCGSPDEEFPWSIITPDPETCYFPIERAPFRPSLFARHYKQLVRDVQKTFSGRKNYKNGTWDNVSPQLTYFAGKFDWQPLGSDRPIDAETTTTDAKDPFEMVDIMELHDQDTCTYLALHKNQTSNGSVGEIVWTGKSMTGGVSAVVLPGHYSSVGPLSERMQPKLWPAMQMTLRINGINAELATRSRNLKPDVVVERTPEMLQAQATAGVIAQGQTAALEAGGPNIVEVNGRATPWALLPDPDLMTRLQEAWKELNRYIDAESEISDPEVIKDAGVNSYLTNLESRRKQQEPMLSYRAWGWKKMIEMYFYSLGEYDKEFELYSVSGQEHIGVKKGQQYTISAKDIDFKKWITVEIKSTTEAESRMRVQDWAYKHGLGIARKDEGLTAAGYADETAQAKALAIDAGREMIAGAVKQGVLLALAERVRLRGMDISGILGTPPPEQPPVAGQGQPGQAGPGAGGFRPAVVPGPQGGTGQAVA